MDIYQATKIAEGKTKDLHKKVKKKVINIYNFFAKYPLLIFLLEFAFMLVFLINCIV